MEEELTGIEPQTPEPQEPAAPEPDAAPAPEPTDDLAAREAAIAKRERELQQGFDKLARKQRETEQPATPTEPVPELDEDAARAVDARVEAKYGPILTAAETMYQDSLRREFNDAAAKHGIESDVLLETIQEYGLRPDDVLSAESRLAVIDRAAKLVKASGFDPEAERNRLKEEVLQELADQGVRIEAVKPGRPAPDAGAANFDDDGLSAAERYRIASENENARRILG